MPRNRITIRLLGEAALVEQRSNTGEWWSLGKLLSR